MAILGVLAAVVIPNWASTARNKKYDPEISAMFTEISTHEEQYKSEIGNGAYLAEAECPGAPIPAGGDFNANCVTDRIDVGPAARRADGYVDPLHVSGRDRLAGPPCPARRLHASHRRTRSRAAGTT